MRTESLRSPLVITATALLVRVGTIAYLYSAAHLRPESVWSNGYEMAFEARSIAAGQGFSSPFGPPTGPTAILPPGYPALLAGIFRLFGTMTPAAAVAAIALNLALSAVACLVIFNFARKTLGTRAAIAAAWIWAVYPPVILSAGFHAWDGALTATLAAVGYLLAAGLRDGKIRAWAWYGAMWGIGALVNPSLIAVYGVLLGWGCWTRARARQVWVRNTAVAMLVAAIVIAPWTIRNYRIFHAFMPVRSNFGLELWMGNHAGGNGYFHLMLYPLGSPAELAQYNARGEPGFMRWKQQQAIAFIRSQPAEFLRLNVYRVRCFWGGIYESGYAPIFLPTTLLGLAGLALLARRDRELLWFYLLPLLVYPIPYYITHPDLRFRFPIEPLLAALSGYAVVTFISALSKRRSAEKVTAAATAP